MARKNENLPFWQFNDSIPIITIVRSTSNFVVVPKKDILKFRNKFSYNIDELLEILIREMLILRTLDNGIKCFNIHGDCIFPIGLDEGRGYGNEMKS